MSYVQIQKFVYILFSFIVLGYSVSHLIEISMLISQVGMLTQTRTGIGKGTRGRGQYALLMSKSRFFIHFQLSVIVLGISASHFLEMTTFII